MVAADPGDTTEGALVLNSKDLSALGLADPVVIVFNGDVAPSISGGNGATVAADTSHVAVTLAQAGTDIVAQGTGADGSITVSGDYAFNLYLNGLGLASASGAAINNDGSGAMNVTLVEGTANQLIDGAGGDQKAAFYSKGDFSLGGGGALEVSGKTAHAIAAKGAFVQTGGTIWAKEAVKDGVNAKTVTISGGVFTSRTKGDGIQGDDGVTITGGTFTIITTADDTKVHGVKSDGDITVGSNGASTPVMDITVYGSGSKCFSADGNIAIHSGVFTLNTEGNGFWDASSKDADKTSGCAGIKCDGDLFIDGGSFTMLSTGTGGKGINVDGDIIISGGTFDITTTGKSYVYGKYDSKSKAVKADGNLTINNGTFTIKTHFTDAEGLESKKTLTINGGLIEIEANDDGINAANHIQINGGNIYCNSAANDGIDSNGTLTITGGVIISLGTTRPEEGFDCDNNIFTVTGGVLIGLGGATSKPTAGTTTACTVECNVNYSALYHIESSDGVEVMTFAPPRTYNGTVCMLFGGGGLAKGTAYTLYSGGSVSGGEDFHGLYTGATYTKGSSAGTFTGSAYATVGTASGSPGPGGQPGTPGTPGRPW
ncbi:MAG: carbohydrate-binding domain-containing protein [Treponema sp.]|nr:carbohydrate-binding domain-containing protein [Treponema sp.]